MSFEHYLIEAVKKQPVLYNRKHSQYNNKPDVEKAWTNVVNAVNKHFDVHVNHCKLRWRSLRDRYVKQIEKTPEGTLRTQEARKWVYTAQLDFLLKHLHKRKYDVNPSDYDETYYNHTPVKSDRVPSSPRPRTFSFVETSNAPNLECSTTLQFLSENEFQEYDDIEQELEKEIPTKQNKKTKTEEEYVYDQAEFPLAEEPEEENQIDKLLHTVNNMIQLQLQRDAEKSPNDAYFKVLDTYFSKLQEEDLNSVKVEILNLVLAKSKKHKNVCS